MKSPKKVIPAQEKETKEKDISEDKLFILIKDLYEQRAAKKEREKKFLLEGFISATKGKDIFLKTDTPSVL